MRSTVHRLCLVVVLLIVVGRGAHASSGVADPPEPPPAPLVTPDAAGQPEPPPAPLLTTPDPADLPEPPPAPLVLPQVVPPDATLPRARSVSRGQASRNTAWAGVAVTLALVTTGTVFGVLTQQRSDSLSRSTTQLIDGLAPVYDAAQHTAFTDLQNQGRTYNNVTIGCFFAGGTTALVSAILFWHAGRLAVRDKTLALVPSASTSGGTVTLVGRF